MKKFLVILSILPALAMAQHTAHYKTVPPGGYWNYPAAPGDTLFLQGNYTYLSFGNVSGAAASPIVIIGDNAVMSNGFNFSDCNYFHITGHIKIKNAPGTALSISGKSNHFEIDGVEIDTAFYFLWFKTEPADHPCDSSYWHSMNMDGLYVHDCNFNYCHQDGCYVGSTDQKADRAVTCNGKTYYPFPATVSNIRFERVKMTNAQRTFLQISGCSGNNFVKNCNFNNAGFELNPYQGAGLALGGNDVGNYEICFDTIQNTYLNNFYSYASGNVSFHDNVLDSADVVSGIINQQKNASVLLSVTKQPTTWKVYNNKIGWSNNNVAIVLYGPAESNSCIWAGNVDNYTGKTFSACDVQQKNYDTTFQTISITHDSTISFIVFDSVKVIDSTQNLSRSFKSKKKKNNFVDVSKTFGHYEFAPKEIFETIKTTHDTTIQVIVVSEIPIQQFGILAAGVSVGDTEKMLDSAGLKLLRAAVFFGQRSYSKAVDQYLQDGYDVAINFNYLPTASTVPFPTDQELIKSKADSFFKYYLPFKNQIPFVAVENEWDNTNYHSGSISYYLNELKIISDVAHQYGFKTADAGTTSTNLQRWTYSQLIGNDAVQWAATHFIGKNNASYQQVIDMLNYYSKSLKNTGVDYCNVHYYTVVDSCLNSLTKMSAAWKQATGFDQLITNEFGTKIPAQWSCTVAEIIQQNMLWAIAYSGVNQENKAIKLSADQLKELK